MTLVEAHKIINGVYNVQSKRFRSKWTKRSFQKLFKRRVRLDDRKFVLIIEHLISGTHSPRIVQHAVAYVML